MHLEEPPSHMLRTVGEGVRVGLLNCFFNTDIKLAIDLTIDAYLSGYAKDKKLTALYSWHPKLLNHYKRNNLLLCCPSMAA
jgi:hypothetical protein